MARRTVIRRSGPVGRPTQQQATAAVRPSPRPKTPAQNQQAFIGIYNQGQQAAGLPLYGQPGAAGAPAGPPPDPMFIAQQNAANRGLGLGAAWDRYSLGQIENQYGYGADVSNPFARAKLYDEEYQQGQRGTLNSYASQGQLYSGALQNAKDYNARQYAIRDDASRRQYQGAKDQITKGAIDRYSSTIGNVSQQDLDSLLRQLGAI